MLLKQKNVFFKMEKTQKIKYRCVDCGSSQICEHKKSKYYCKMCKSSKFDVSSVLPDDFQLIFQRNPLKYFKMIFK